MTFGEKLFAAFRERRKLGPIDEPTWIAIANTIFEENTASGKRIPSCDEWLAYCAEKYPKWPRSDALKAWQHYESLGWKKGKTLIQKWRMCASTCFQNYIDRGGGGQQPARRKEAWELAIEQQKNNKPD